MGMREKLIDIVEAYADFLDWDTKDEMVDSIMELLATDKNVGHKWIPVTERLPDKAEKCLAVVKSLFGKGNPYIQLMWYGKNGFHYSDPDFGYMNMNRYVTHWMPLPEPPKGE